MSFYTDTSGRQIPVTPGTPLPVDASVTANTSAKATAAAPSYSEGTDQPLSQDLAGNLRIAGTISASTTAHATAANPSYTEGSDDALSQDLSGHLRVAGTFWQTTQPVSASSLPLPTGAATSAKQPALGTAGTASADVISVQGIASMTALKVDGSGVTQPVSGTFWQATQPVSGTVTANAGTNLNTSALALETGGNLATLAGAVSSARMVVQGAAASGATAAGNPLLSGARAASTAPTAVTDGQAVALMADLVGKLVVTPHAPRALIGAVSATATDNSSHTLIAAGATGVFNDILSLTLTTESATGSLVTISDGTVSYYFYLPPTDTRGQTYQIPLIATSTATAWTFQATAAITTLRIAATYIARKA